MIFCSNFNPFIYNVLICIKGWWDSPVKIDAVFSGGGVKAYTFIGALKGIEKKGLKIRRVAGTSAGAIISSLIIANYSPKEIEEIFLSLPLKDFLDSPKYTTILPFTKWYNLFFKMGFFKGNKLERWLEEMLAKKDIHTFEDIKNGHLKIIVSDITLNRLIVLPDDLEKVYGISPANFPVAKAVRISAGYPLFFMPGTIEGQNTQAKSLLVDGGIVSNFPLWLFTNNHGRSKRPILGLKIISNDRHQNINNMIDMLQAILLTMKQSYDERVIDKYFDDIIFLRVNDIDTMNLNISEDDKLQMIASGEEITDKFLSTWPK